MQGKPANTSFLYLKEKWTRQQKEIERKIWMHHGDALDWFKHIPQQLIVGSLASLLMFTHNVTQTSYAQFSDPPDHTIQMNHTQEELVAKLAQILPQTVQPLSVEQDVKLSKLLTDFFHVPVWAVLGGNQLNRTYGYIGAEQHLMRFPGDVVENMAPGRGAWGYFAESGDAMTQKDIDREKYYIAVQTFLSPGWHERSAELSRFFKYRKMLVVNPDNGHAMVVVIGDAGPAEWTGKHLGGSPEVMQYLERHDGVQKGPVLYYFIDDPEDKIPLGPITVK